MDASADASARPTSWAVGGLDSRFCLLSAERGAFCGVAPDLRRARDDGGAPAWALTNVAGSAGIVEATRRANCVRSSAGIVRCNDAEVARNVRSMEAHPYLLRDDGSILVVTDRDSDDVHAAREKIVRALPPMTRVVRAGDGACGLSRDGEVWCWTEPTFGFNQAVELPATIAPKKVPGLNGVIDLFVQPWLTLCALTKDGAVSCSSASGPPTEICMLRGSSTIRCGPGTKGPGGPPDLVGEGYDARRSLERALVAVPDIAGASALAAYRREPSMMLESTRRILVSGVDAGGCAQTAEGVRCWEHDPCKPKEPWRSTKVEGLPRELREMVLGADAGYAITESGELHRWPRRDVADGACAQGSRPFTIHARRIALDGRVARVTGDVFPRVLVPGSQAVDCAVLERGPAWCWSGDSDGRERVAVPLP